MPVGLTAGRCGLERGAGDGGEYQPPPGFGWTDGVTALFMGLLGPLRPGMAVPGTAG